MRAATLVVFAVMAWASLGLADEVLPVIQRYAVVGTSEDGTRLAIMLTHFGPSSNAPFANLYVYEADKAVPVLTDGESMMVGNEPELASLAASVFERNKPNLLKLGINFSTPVYGDANYVLSPTSKIDDISGQLDIENAGMKHFRIQPETSGTCPSVPHARIDVRIDQKLISIEPAKAEDCIAGAIQLRTIIRTRTAAWFIILRNADALGIPFYLVSVVGAAW